MFRQSLTTGQSPRPYINIEVDAATLLYNLEEALTAILNVIINNDVESHLLNEATLIQLGSLLNVPYFRNKRLIF